MRKSSSSEKGLLAKSIKLKNPQQIQFKNQEKVRKYDENLKRMK